MPTSRAAMSVEGRSFKLWLTSELWKAVHIAPKKHHVEDALAHLCAKAVFEGPSMPVGVRVLGTTGEEDDRIYLDLADEKSQVVEVRAGDWRVLTSREVPVRFRRTPAILPLPTPVREGSIADLRPFLNLAKEEEFCLIAAWLAMCLRPTGPYPVLLLTGEQGSGKTTMARLLRSLIDPHKPALRREPHSDEDLWLGAWNTWQVCFDNLSHLRPWLSDSLCCLATGGGYSTRRFYVNDEEVHFDACRPVMLTSITDVAQRPDLLDRCLLNNLPPLADADRRPEKDFWREFEEVRPRILGALLNAVATALQREPCVETEGLPRMADFFRWSVAAETAFGWEAGAFESAYWANIATAGAVALDDSPLVAPLLRLLAKSGCWPAQGEVRTAEDLLKDLRQAVGGPLASERIHGWPKLAGQLVHQLKKLGTVLRREGVHVEYLERESTGQRRKPIRITVVPKEAR